MHPAQSWLKRNRKVFFSGMLADNAKIIEAFRGKFERFCKQMGWETGAAKVAILKEVALQFENLFDVPHEERNFINGDSWLEVHRREREDRKSKRDFESFGYASIEDYRRERRDRKSKPILKPYIASDQDMQDYYEENWESIASFFSFYQEKLIENHLICKKRKRLGAKKLVNKKLKKFFADSELFQKTPAALQYIRKFIVNDWLDYVEFWLQSPCILAQYEEQEKLMEDIRKLSGSAKKEEGK